jgi:hypothetical protein
VPEFSFIFISFMVAYIYSGLLEWFLHKYILHGLGKNKKSIFSFHWHFHHKTCRKNDNFDEDYRKFPPPPSVKKEILFLTLLVAAHVPFFFVAPYFFIGLLFYTGRYFYYHRRAHLDVAWAKKNIPWHYEHHTGKNQDANYGVTVEWPDKLFNTRRTK